MYVSITSSLVQQCHAPGLVAVTKLKPQKLIIRAFSDFPRKLDPTKTTRHTVSPIGGKMNKLLYNNIIEYLTNRLVFAVTTL